MTPQQAHKKTSASEVDLRDELSGGTWHARKQAVSRLVQTADSPTVEQLLTMLRDEHRDLARVNAAIEVLTHTTSDVVPGLLELLDHTDTDLRCYVALTLGERGDPRAIPALIQRLADADTNVRSHAIEALGKLRAAAAVDALIGFVEELNFELAFPALEALKAIGDRRIAHRLLPLLNQPLYKLAAIEAIGELGDEEVIRPLLDRFQDTDVPSSAVGIALAKMHERHEEVYGACGFIPELVRGMTSPSVAQGFLSTVANDIPDARLATVLSWVPGDEIDWTLASLLERFPFDEKVIHAVANRGNSIIALLTGRLAGASLDVRRATIEVLSRLADRKAVPTMLEIVESDDDEQSIARSLEALTRLSEPRLYQAALQHFGHPSASVRQAAVAAFGCTGRESAINDLQTLWSSPSPLVRESVLRAAAYLGDPEVVEIVIAGCTDADDQVCRTAIEQLGTIEDDRAAELLKVAICSQNQHVRVAAVKAIPRTALDLATAESLIGPALNDSDVWVRYFAIREIVALGRVNQHLPELIATAKEDPAMQVRIAAMEALAHGGGGAYATLSELASSDVTELADAALLSLSHSGHPQALSVLSDWLSSASESKRRKAAEGLADLGTPEAVAKLRSVALSTDHRLAIEAAAALGRIAFPAAADALVEVLAWPQRREVAIQSLVNSPGVAVAAIQSELANTSIDVRRTSVEVLSRIRTPAAIEVLESALQDSAAAVRHAALTALAHLSAKPVDNASEPARGRRH